MKVIVVKFSFFFAVQINNTFRLLVINHNMKHSYRLIFKVSVCNEWFFAKHLFVYIFDAKQN